jgi:hypothetical protein
MVQSGVRFDRSTAISSTQDIPENTDLERIFGCALIANTSHAHQRTGTSVMMNKDECGYVDM